MRLRSYLAVAVLTSSVCAAEETITLACEPLEVAKGAAFGEAASRSSLSATLRLTNSDSSFERPLRASVGFSEVGRHRDGSIHFFIIGNREAERIVAGYRLHDRGRNVEVELVDNLPLNTNVQVAMKIDKGLVTLAVPPLDPITIQTGLAVVGHGASTSCGVSLEISYDP